MSPDDERGSVLMLMPAAVLVLVVLAAIAVDAGLTFMAQRELQNATAAAANDAAVAALEEQPLYECGALEVNEERAIAVAEAAFDARGSDAVETIAGPAVSVAGGGGSGPIQVTVTARGRVRLLFTPGIGEASSREVTASTTATPQLAPGSSWPSDECE